MIANPADQSTLSTLDALYNEHHRVALGLAYRILGNRSDAEDAVQEAFLSVWRSLGTFDGRVGTMRTWLLSAVRNRSIDLLRSRRRRPEHVLEENAAAVDPGVVDSTAMATADREYVLDLMADLHVIQREALELAYFGGLSHTEIAQLLRVPVGTVKSRIRLALDRLRVATRGMAELSGRAAGAEAALTR